MNSLQVVVVEEFEMHGLSENCLGLSEKPASHGPNVVEGATLNENEDLKVLRPQLMRAPLEAHVPDIDDIFAGQAGEKIFFLGFLLQH